MPCLQAEAASITARSLKCTCTKQCYQLPMEWFPVAVMTRPSGRLIGISSSFAVKCTYFKPERDQLAYNFFERFLLDLVNVSPISRSIVNVMWETARKVVHCHLQRHLCTECSTIACRCWIRRQWYCNTCIGHAFDPEA